MVGEHNLYSTFNSHFVGPCNITSRCSKCCVGRLSFKPSSCHPTIIFWGPISFRNVMIVTCYDYLISYWLRWNKLAVPCSHGAWTLHSMHKTNMSVRIINWGISTHYHHIYKRYIFTLESTFKKKCKLRNLSKGKCTKRARMFKETFDKDLLVSSIIDIW